MLNWLACVHYQIGDAATDTSTYDSTGCLKVLAAVLFRISCCRAGVAITIIITIIIALISISISIIIIPIPTQVMLSWLLQDEPMDAEETLAVGVLDHLLMGTSAAPLYKDLLILTLTLTLTL